MQRLAACVIWLFLLTGSAAAENPFTASAAQAAPRPEATQAARRLMDALGVDAAMQTMVDRLVPQIVRNASLGRGLTEEQMSLVSGVVADEMRNELPTLRELVVRAYAQRFTIEDMNAMADFFESPPGRRYVAASPQLMADLFSIGQAWGMETIGPRVVARIEEMGRKGGALHNP